MSKIVPNDLLLKLPRNFQGAVQVHRRRGHREEVKVPGKLLQKLQRLAQAREVFQDI